MEQLVQLRLVSEGSLTQPLARGPCGLRRLDRLHASALRERCALSKHRQRGRRRVLLVPTHFIIGTLDLLPGPGARHDGFPELGALGRSLLGLQVGDVRSGARRRLGRILFGRRHQSCALGGGFDARAERCIRIRVVLCELRTLRFVSTDGGQLDHVLGHARRRRLLEQTLKLEHQLAGRLRGRGEREQRDCRRVTNQL